MTLWEHNIVKLHELLPNCEARGIRWMTECFAEGKDFRISEAYRTQERQNELWMIGRRGIEGEKPVTYTKSSKHTLKTAIDVYPVSLPDPYTIKGFNHRGSDKQIKERLQAHRLTELQMIGVKHGIYRPAGTLAFGDLVHFQIYDIPLPIESPEVIEKREKRMKKRIEESERIARIVAERKAGRTDEPAKSRILKRLHIPPSL